MNKFLGLLILPLVACQATPNQADIDARVALIENGILAGIQIQGEPVNTATLEERMAGYASDSIPGGVDLEAGGGNRGSHTG